MNRYHRPGRTLCSVMAILFVFVFVLGIILSAINSENIGLSIFLLGFGGFGGFCFATGGIAAQFSYLQIEDNKIRFPHYITVTQRDGKKKKIKRKTAILFCDLQSISLRFYDGDGIITGDTVFYRFTFKNGDTFETFFHQYGKSQEREIVHRLKQAMAAHTKTAE